MKLIDLFNKIANGEYTPEQIKFHEQIFTHNGDEGNAYYIGKETDKILEESFIFEELNDEVEIIEDKRIEKLSNVTIYGTTVSILRNELQATNKRFETKLNEIIDKINGKE